MFGIRNTIWSPIHQVLEPWPAFSTCGPSGEPSDWCNAFRTVDGITVIPRLAISQSTEENSEIDSSTSFFSSIALLLQDNENPNDQRWVAKGLCRNFRFKESRRWGSTEKQKRYLAALQVFDETTTTCRTLSKLETMLQSPEANFLKDYVKIFVFRYGVEPVVEDPHNKGGYMYTWLCSTLQESIEQFKILTDDLLSGVLEQKLPSLVGIAVKDVTTTKNPGWRIQIWCTSPQSKQKNLSIDPRRKSLRGSRPRRILDADFWDYSLKRLHITSFQCGIYNKTLSKT